MKIKILLFLMFIITLNGCKQNTNNQEITFHNEDSIASNNGNQTSRLNIDDIKASILTSSSIKSILTKEMKIIIDNISHLFDISDSTSLWLIPLEEPMLKHYLIVLTIDDDISSFVKVKGAWIDNDELEYSEEFRFLTKPLIYIEDVTNDKYPELVIKDRQHIGNTYNSAVKHFFNLKNGNIEYLYSFEYISHLPVENKFLIRHWDTTNIVNVFVKDVLRANDSLKVGDFNMYVNENQLNTSNLNIVMPEYKDVLVSGMDNHL